MHTHPEHSGSSPAIYLSGGRLRYSLNSGSMFQVDGAVKSGDSGDSVIVCGTLPRKLTRSLSARVSRIAAATRLPQTDTDSEVDEKPNDKRLYLFVNDLSYFLNCSTVFDCSHLINCEGIHGTHHY